MYGMLVNFLHYYATAAAALFASAFAAASDLFTAAFAAAADLFTAALSTSLLGSLIGGIVMVKYSTPISYG